MDGKTSRWSVAWPLGVLCCGLASRWMVSELRPGSASTVVSLGLGTLLAAGLCALAAVRRDRVPEWRRWRLPAVAGALLLGGPELGVLIPVRGLEAESWTLALALTPVCVAVAVVALSRGGDGVAGRLWPGIAAVAGLLLVLPQPSLSSVGNDLVLLAAPLLTGVGAAWFCALEEGGEHAWRMAAGLTGATMLFAGAAGLQAIAHAASPLVFSPLALAIDAPLALLLVLALVRAGPTRWSAQFAIVPLLVLAEAMVLLRPDMTWRLGVGLGVVAIGGVALLLPPGGDGPLPSIAEETTD